MKVVTVITDPQHKDFQEFLATSCDFFGLDLTVLQVNQQPYVTHRIKDLALERFLEGVDDEEIILFCDGYDTVFVAGQEEILTKYHAFGSPLVFSAEVNCWPSKQLATEYGPEGDSRYRYLNSGGFIGTAGEIKKLYSEYPILVTPSKTDYPWSNQYYWHSLYLNSDNNDIVLDTGCSIFYAITSVPILDGSPADGQGKRNYIVNGSESPDFELKEKRLHCFSTGSLPCHLHFNSTPSKAIMKKEFSDLTRFYSSKASL